MGEPQQLQGTRQKTELIPALCASVLSPLSTSVSRTKRWGTRHLPIMDMSTSPLSHQLLFSPGCEACWKSNPEARKGNKEQVLSHSNTNGRSDASHESNVLESRLFCLSFYLTRHKLLRQRGRSSPTFQKLYSFTGSIHCEAAEWKQERDYQIIIL